MPKGETPVCPGCGYPIEIGEHGQKCPTRFEQEQKPEADFDAEASWHEAAILDDLVGHLFKSDGQSWEAFAQNYDTSLLPPESAEKFRGYLANFKAEQEHTSASISLLEERLKGMGNPDSLSPEFRLGRMVMVFGKAKPRGQVRFERQGPFVVLHIEDDADMKTLAHREPDAEQFDEGLHIPEFTMESVGQGSTLPVIVLNESRPLSKKTTRSILNHERGHFLYQKVFRRQEQYAEGDPWTAANDLKDELLAHIGDETPTEIIGLTLRKNYQECIMRIPEDTREGALLIIDQAMSELAVFDQRMAGDRSRLMLALAEVSFPEIPKAIKELSAYLEKKYGG